jgi:hypothetical protein
MSKRFNKKMTGIDVYICIDNSNEQKCLTIGKPYRVLSICRDCVYEQFVFIKNDKQKEGWYHIKRFRPRNSEDDRERGKHE